jgi:predicted Rossmann fold flavoprotein
MKRRAEKIWDVIVIGGGPAGMMAAATAAARGVAVLLLEKNDGLGKKLRITGGGRCNVTNNKPDNHKMLAQYKGRGKFLFSTFAQHGVADTVSWLRERNVTLKEENEGRMFPVTDSADTIYEAMLAELRATGVEIVSNSTVTDVAKQSDETFLISCNELSYTTKSCVIATGGTSRPDTGSTGDGFTFATTLGHTVHENDMALVPLMTKELWVREVSGVSLPDVTLTVTVDGAKAFKTVGKILFTHTGISGPTVLNLSKDISDLLQSGTVTLSIDLFPTQDLGTLRTSLTTLFHAESNKKVRNALKELVPTSLAKTLLDLSSIDPETPCHSVRVEEKKSLSSLMKALPLTIIGLLGTDKAIVSSGGVALEEVDFKTMESKRVPGLFLVGDVLDIDRPSGGYSLQLCWSTGYVAGLHVGN